MKLLTPTMTPRRSPLYRRHTADRAMFSDFAGAIIVDRYFDAALELAAANRMGICDLSTLPRTGMTGRGAANVLRARAIDIPTEPNESRCQENGDRVAKLSAEEFLLLGSSVLADSQVNVSSRWTEDPEQQAYSLPRRDSHCWFALTGTQADSALAKICGIDFRGHKFANGRVAQTSVARVSTIVIRNDFGATPGYFLLASSAATEYLWDCLLDAMAEFDGRAIGVIALNSLTRS